MWLCLRHVILAHFLDFYVPLPMVTLPSVLAALLSLLAAVIALHGKRGPAKVVAFVVLAGEALGLSDGGGGATRCALRPCWT